MPRKLLWTAAFCLLAAIAVSLNAQTEAVAQPNTKSVGPAAGKDPEAARIARERRANAQALLISLSADAGRFNDQTLRARTQARIADALWDADPDAARTLFRKAWESAVVAEEEAQRKQREEKQRPGASGQNREVLRPPNVRNEVLRLAAKRDRALGEELLAKLKAEKAEEAADASGRHDPYSSPEAIKQRLTLARQLLATDVGLAIQIADPALGAITMDVIEFLSFLREKDAAAADRRYLALLASAAVSNESDANTVSLLSSYCLTPHIFAIFTADNVMIGGGDPTGPIPVTSEATTQFFRTAAGILSRPLPPPGQEKTTTRAQDKYYVLKRLLPLFEQLAPKELTELMRAQMDAIGATMSEEARHREDESVREGIQPREERAADREKSLQDAIDHAKTSDERDDLFLELAEFYAEQGDVKARDFVDKIADSEVRQQARTFIDTELISRAIEKKDGDKTLELVRTGTLTHALKSWALLKAAKLLATADREKAVATLEEAYAEARRIEDSDANRPRTLMGLANVWLLVERAKSWDTVNDAIRAANSVESYLGEDGFNIRVSVHTKNGGSDISFRVPEFNLSGVFSELAKEDFSRTVDLARGFQRESPRANATIAIARAVLEEKTK